MFGYITANSVTLSKTAKAQYRKAYCGLCHALSDRYGAKARFILSFDTAFLLSVLCETKGEDVCRRRCPYKFTNRECICGDISQYAADVNVLLTYLNFKDDSEDTKKFLPRVMLSVYKKAYEKAKSLRPELAKEIKKSLLELADAEKKGVTDPDIPADIFGRLLSKVFAFGDPSLYEFGYALGRFIYLCDAVCDFKADIKHRRYNPLVMMRQSDFEGMLMVQMNTCLDEYEKLGIQNELIDNVLTDGVWLKYMKHKIRNR